MIAVILSCFGSQTLQIIKAFIYEFCLNRINYKLLQVCCSCNTLKIENFNFECLDQWFSTGVPRHDSVQLIYAMDATNFMTENLLISY